MNRIFFGLLFFGILTLWVQDLWPVSVFLAGTFLLMICELLSTTRPPRHRLTVTALLLLTLLPAWALVQLLFRTTVYAEPTRLAFLAVLSYPCIGFLVSGLSARRMDLARLAMLWFAFVVSIIAILQHATSGGKIFWLFETPYSAQAMGPILSRNHWAAFVEAILPIALYYALRSTESLWLFAAMAGSLYASVIAGASRAGTVLCTLELLVVPLLIARTRRLPSGAARALVPIVATVALFTLIVGPEAVLDRLMQPDPYSMRRDIIEPSLAMVREHPGMGIGVANWPNVYPQYATIDFGVFVNQAHNDWLQWAAEGGILYAAVYLLLAALACRQAWSFPWAAGVPAVFCHAFVDYPFSRPALAAWTLSVFALSLAAGESRIGISTLAAGRPSDGKVSGGHDHHAVSTVGAGADWLSLTAIDSVLSQIPRKLSLLRRWDASSDQSEEVCHVNAFN